MEIAIVTYPGMTALDAIGPYEVLRALPGAHIRFVWHEPGPIATDSGVLVLAATHALSETPAPDIVLVGGSGPATARTANDEALLAWLRRVHETTMWTTSVCSGSIILAAAGLLEGKAATSHWATVAGLSAFGAKPQRDQRIVREGKIVTAAGVSAGIDLALWLAGVIAGEQTARAIQLLIEYDPGGTAGSERDTDRALEKRDPTRTHQPTLAAHATQVNDTANRTRSLADARRRRNAGRTLGRSRSA